MSRLDRFLQAQNQHYALALEEISKGRKTSHWMWYIFPQIKGLGSSDMAVYYAIDDLQEASNYLSHPVLGPNLIKISTVLFELNKGSAHQIFGSPDDLKLHSSMTLFAKAKGTDPIFSRVLEKYFHGNPDERTLQLLEAAYDK
ncbi:DUF1810 domain-containing protein [Pedobacter sp.]